MQIMSINEGTVKLFTMFGENLIMHQLTWAQVWTDLELWRILSKNYSSTRIIHAIWGQSPPTKQSKYKAPKFLDLTLVSRRQTRRHLLFFKNKFRSFCLSVLFIRLTLQKIILSINVSPVYKYMRIIASSLMCRILYRF